MGDVPEGDTIHRLARRFRPLFVGKRLVRVRAPRSSRTLPPPGTRVADVVAEGKHLLVRFEDGHELRTHLGMWGRWRLLRPGAPVGYGPGDPWVRAVLELDDVTAVCLRAKEAELLRRVRAYPLARVPTGETTGETARTPSSATVTHLGPDLCREDADLDETLRRLGALPADTPIVDALLDQRVFTGVGNVFKSELLWAVGVSPHACTGDVPDTTRRALVAHAARLLRRNVLLRRRTTVAGPPGSLAVYGRAGRPCRRCGEAVERLRLGREGRSTYHCPGCQR